MNIRLLFAEKESIPLKGRFHYSRLLEISLYNSRGVSVTLLTNGAAVVAS